MEMINRMFDTVEEVLQHIDVGGEQSRQFAPEIKLLKKILGYPEQLNGFFEQGRRRDLITRKLRRLAAEAEGLKATLPRLPVEKWFDGTFENTDIDILFDEYDLAQLIRFLADVGVSYSE
jgi:hypothetical protein